MFCAMACQLNQHTFDLLRPETGFAERQPVLQGIREWRNRCHHRAQLRVPNTLVGALQYVGDKERQIWVYLPRSAFVAEQAAKLLPIELLAFVAQNEPQVV